MSTRTAELLAGIGLLVFSLVLMWTVYTDGLTIGWVEGRGPGAGVWPFWLSLGMALTSLWTVVRWVRRTTAESRNETPYIDSDPFALVAVSFVALTAMIFLVTIVGTYIAIALFLGFYMRFIGKHTWGMTTASVIGAVIFIYFLFEWQLTKYLPKGLPIFEDGFLWIDNFRWEYLM
ncbi:MAG: tripartite tricarboxylate transporter TctB family protein [Arenicellales bacterium]